MPGTLLLGNGFSRAYDNDIFSYDALRTSAGLPPRLNQVFANIGTSDFELVMRRLAETVAILPAYEVPGEYTTRMSGDIDVVRNSLIIALRAHHPERADVVTAAASQACGRFLAPFDRIFTLNYDLLLYWVVVQQLIGQKSDGFGGPHGDVHWQGPDASGQSVFFLHGALHLYDTGTRVDKLQYNLVGTPILDQLDTSMRHGHFPLFVSEGQSSQKLARIRSSQYLLDAYEALSKNDLPLTVYGFKFGDMDKHILDAIARSNTPNMTVAIHDTTDDEERASIQERVRTLARRTHLPGGGTCGFRFVDSPTMPIWT
jgi:hypothetical protein